MVEELPEQAGRGNSGTLRKPAPFGRFQGTYQQLPVRTDAASPPALALSARE